MKKKKKEPLNYIILAFLIFVIIAVGIMITNKTKNIMSLEQGTEVSEDIEKVKEETKKEETKTGKILSETFKESEVIFGKDNEFIINMFKDTGLDLNLHIKEISVIKKDSDYIILFEPNYDYFGAFLNGVIDFQTKISIEENPTIPKKEAIKKVREKVVLEQIGAYMVFIKTDTPLNTFNQIKDYLTKVG